MWADYVSYYSIMYNITLLCICVFNIHLVLIVLKSYFWWWDLPDDLLQEFIALEVRDNKVKFSWDVGGGQGSITHDLQLKVFGASEEEVNKWYRIQAKRWASVE